MSSILKALKKIEGRKVDKGLPAWPYGTGNLESMDSHIQRSRKRQKILGILIILCAIGLAGKLYIGSRQDSGNTASKSTPLSNAPPEKAAEAAKRETQRIVAEKPQSTPEPSPKEATAETTPSSTISPPPADDTPAPRIISPPAAAPGETDAMEGIPEMTVTETFSTPPADNAGLSLMALVWSQQPGSRFVVINGTIVHEGGSIEDSTVVRIEEEYAVMRTGGVRWKLK